MDRGYDSEIRTRRGPGIAGTVALLLLAAFWGATAFGTGAPAPTGPLRLDLRVRRLFDLNAPGIRTLSLPFNAVLHRLGEQRGSPKVVVARSRRFGGVLFYLDEVEIEHGQPRTRAALRVSLESIRARLAVLRAAGVSRVVMVPVPNKYSVTALVDPSVAPDACAVLQAKDAASVGPPPTCDGTVTAAMYREMVDALSREDVGLVVLADLFGQETRRGRPVFAWEETHWTSYGKALAAREVLRAWKGTAPEPVWVGRAPDREGDLQVMLALPNRPELRTHPLAEDQYDLPPATAPCTDKVFLLGSSYSAQESRLAPLLRRGSGCAIVDLASPGRTADAPFRPLLERHAGELAGAVVIWEFPFRHVLSPGTFERAERIRR